jgi:microsomal dipeptidase-like Zn-dependent dipeptidase
VVRRGVPPLALAALVLALAVAAPAAAAPSRYSLQGGCYSLQRDGKVVPGGEHLRLQATTLASYLLYRPDGTFLASKADGSLAPAAQPSPAADWRVAEAGSGFTIAPASAPTRRLAVRFLPATGCAVYPEAELDASGKPARGKTSYGTVGGLVEGHMHWMTFEYLGGDFHCGRPWHPYGIRYALPDCSSIEGPQGSAAPIQNFLNFGQPAAPHDTRGYPQMTEWGPHNLTYEGTYWRWIQRAWLSGLRLMVMSVNENRELCQLMPRKRNSCDEMTTVRKGYNDMRELQRYVDAQAGGPGKGFFQIVTSPNQARRVINQGRMAVVLEIEVSELFGCRGWDQPSCSKAQIDRGLDEFYRMGMRSSLLLNKFDNPLSGVRFDGGPIGYLINAANRQSAGSFWSAETCKGPYHDNTIENPQPSSALSGLLTGLGVPGGTTPTYPPAPHCNTRGLTELGRYLEKRMMQKHMIINPDHMSQRGVDDTLTLLEAHHYSGVISPHGWMDPGNWPRIWKLGGMAFPGHSAAEGYVKDWKKYRPRSTPYKFGWGYGADLGGLSQQPDPSAGVHYPFKSFDGKVTLTRERTGDRTFDYNKDGVAHYGLYADWFQDLRQRGGRKLSRDLWNGAEAYLEMWERATGVRSSRCHIRRAVTARGLWKIRLRRNWETLLRAYGQPQQRNQAWSWCVRGRRNKHRADVAELSKGGRVELAGSTAYGRHAHGIAVGAKSRRVRRAARSIGRGLYLRRASRRATFVFAVRHGRVRAVAVATRSLAHHRSRLRAAMRRLLRAKATQTKPRFVPSATASASRLTGTTLAGTADPRLNGALALLCGLH